MQELLSTIANRVFLGHTDAQSPHPPALKGEVGVKELVEEALEKGIEPLEILNDGLLKGMEAVGEKFRACEIFIPDVLISCQAMRTGAAILKPHLSEGAASPHGKFIIGTVKGDLHDIGKNLVCMMLEGSGFEVVDLGVDVSPERFIAAAKEHPGAPIGLSALLSTTMINMEKSVKELNEADLPKRVITVIGGAPVTQSFAEEIGASAYAPDASSAADVVKKIIAAA